MFPNAEVLHHDSPKGSLRPSDSRIVAQDLDAVREEIRRLQAAVQVIRQLAQRIASRRTG